ncbi:hypothetical protein V496_07196 [Pseudogymnoascus sp. VKM F-4515 (FW-2607)]|nr:hypothetical protein V496_07196 [Pseudogymnoascus sp. VKM F-4515 (FW-2607)]
MADERAVETRKQQRKIQNRINQRARRLRTRETGDGEKSAGKNQYQIKCWRLDEHDNTHVQNGTPLDVSTSVINCRIDDSQGPGNGDRFSAAMLELDTIKCDILRRAAQFNVLRGIFGNKSTVMSSTAYYKTVQVADNLRFERIEDSYPVRAITFLTSSNIPASLLPTQLQATVEHWTWIDSIPFPRMRDNLINSEVDYDPKELAHDLIGNLIDFPSFYRFDGPTDTVSVEDKSELPNCDNETTASQNGLVIWGEPHDPGNWEVSPGFLLKWWWTLEGCQDVLDSSNRWRLLRDEEPLATINCIL